VVGNARDVPIDELADGNDERWNGMREVTIGPFAEAGFVHDDRLGEPSIVMEHRAERFTLCRFKETRDVSHSVC
jgi:hypothetical protein